MRLCQKADCSARHHQPLRLRPYIRNAVIYAKKAEEHLFGEIDYAYVCKLNAAMEKDGLCGNTRRN